MAGAEADGSIDGKDGRDAIGDDSGEATAERIGINVMGDEGVKSEKVGGMRVGFMTKWSLGSRTDGR